MSRRSRWPVRVKRGNSTVTIYKADRKKNGHRYREFKLAFYNEIGKRTLQSFNSFKKARKAADNVNVSLMKGEVKSLVLSNDDKVVYLREMTALLSAAGPVMVPFLAMSGFAGLRSKELERLDWAEVQRERGVHRTEALEDQDRPTPVGTDPAESGSVVGTVCARERSDMAVW